MTDSGQDHYFRLVTFVVEGCPKPLIHLFMLKANSDPRPNVAFTDLGTYLQFHEPTIKQSKRRKIIRQDQYDLLFPSTGSVEETKLDISLITSILQNLFALTPQEMGYIQDIRDVRNELYHISGTAKVSDAEFVNKWDKLEEAVTELGKLCSNDVYKEIETFVNRLKQQPLPPADPIINKLKEWYTFETTLHEIKDNIEEGKEIASACKQIASTNKDMIKRASVVSSNRSGKQIKRLKTVDTSLQKLKDHYMRTYKGQLKEEKVSRNEMEDIKTNLNEHHRVVVSGYDKSTNLSSALYAIKELDYNPDRCVQITRAEDWYKVNYEDVDLVLCVDPFGSQRYNIKRANDIATILDYALEESNESNADTRISYVLVTSSRCLTRFKQIDDHELLNMEVVIGSPTENDSDDDCNQTMLDPILQNILAQSRLVIRKYSNDEYSNPKLQSAHEVFEENNLIVISGPRRSGKTSMAMRLLLPHVKDIDRCVVLTNPSDWKHVNVEYINIVIIEDFCGKCSYDREMVSQWLNKFDTIQACIEEGKIGVMITCCDKNLQQCWDEKMWHELLETSIHVDAVENDRTLAFCGPKGYVASCSSVDKGNIREDKSGIIDTTPKTIELNDTLDNNKDVHSNNAKSLFTSATKINQFKVSLEDDKKPCYITGILVDGDLVYIADYNNDKVKLFNINGQHISQASCGDAYDITKIDDRRIAVTTMRYGICIIATEGSTLRVVQTIETTLPGYGITFYNGHIYVVCRDNDDPSVIPQIQVLTMNGELKRRIEPIYQGSSVLQIPEYIAINKQTGTIYVTDWYRDVIAIRSTEEVEFVQQAFSRTRTAQGVAHDENGHLYVCGIETHNVMQISPDGKDVTEILKYGCRNAHAIDIQGDKLFLGCQNTDIIRVFQLT